MDSTDDVLEQAAAKAKNLADAHLGGMVPAETMAQLMARHLTYLAGLIRGGATRERAIEAEQIRLPLREVRVPSLDEANTSATWEQMRAAARVKATLQARDQRDELLDAAQDYLEEHAESPYTDRLAEVVERIEKG